MQNNSILLRMFYVKFLYFNKNFLLCVIIIIFLGINKKITFWMPKMKMFVSRKSTFSEILLKAVGMLGKRKKNVIQYENYSRGMLAPVCAEWTISIQCPPKVKVQPALSFSPFVHNFPINELKNMKLNEYICYEVINWILYYCGFGNSSNE